MPLNSQNSVIRNRRNAQSKGASVPHYDIAIVGGGLVGVSLALSLSQRGYQVALVEAKPLSAVLPDNPLETRALAIAGETQKLLKRLGLWTAEIAKHATPVEQVHISEYAGMAFSRMSAAMLGEPVLGYVVAQQYLWHQLVTLLSDTQIICYSPVMLTDYSELSDGVQLTLDTEGQVQHISADVCVAADGARSTLRKACGIEVTMHNYQQVALVGTLVLKRPHGNTAYERFTESGPLAMLPLEGQHVAFVWCVSAEKAAYYKALPEAEFIAAIQAKFGYRLGRFMARGYMASYPLWQVVPERICQGRVLLLGNAGHSVHPVAGQGFNLSCRDLAQLLDTVEEQGGLTPETWQLFADKQQIDQQRLLGLTDMIIKTFSAPSGFFMRQAALWLLERQPVVKRRLQRFLMGVRRPAAKLMCRDDDETLT